MVCWFFMAILKFFFYNFPFSKWLYYFIFSFEIALKLYDFLYFLISCKDEIYFFISLYASNLLEIRLWFRSFTLFFIVQLYCIFSFVPVQASEPCTIFETALDWQARLLFSLLFLFVYMLETCRFIFAFALSV